MEKRFHFQVFGVGQEIEHKVLGFFSGHQMSLLRHKYLKVLLKSALID